MNTNAPAPTTASADSIRAAKVANLRYVSDAAPGIRRRRAGTGFVYFNPEGRLVRDPTTLKRIRSLVIPPAWTEVWICPDPNGHLQAVGRDARGRKQYRYHARWKEIRDETKYGRMVAFGTALPFIRERVESDLRRRGVPRKKVLATVVRLLELTCIRVGNEEYVRANRSFGLTTLRDRHVEIEGSRLEFQFRGKGGKQHYVQITDRRLARIVKRCQDIPGYELFQYIDKEGKRQTIDSSDVNAYLREISGQDFTAKDFRTWIGTVEAAAALVGCGPAGSAQAAKKNVSEAIRFVSELLGNTPAISRKCYVHPAILDAYTQGVLIKRIARDGQDEGALNGLKPAEKKVLEFLKLVTQ